MSKLNLLFLASVVFLAAGNPINDQVTIYAGTDKGVAISKDKGVSFPKLQLAGQTIYAIRQVDGKVYVAAKNGLYATKDDDDLKVITDKFDDVREFYIAPGSKTIYASSLTWKDGNLYYTHDSGATWKKSSINDPSSIVNGLGELDGIVYGLTHNQGLYQSIDQGVTWKPIPGAKPGVGTCLTISSGRIYMGTVDGVFVSVDKAKTWKKITKETGLPDSYINVVLVKKFSGETNETIYIQGLGGVFVSKDYGITGKPVFESEKAILSVDVSDDGTIYIGSSDRGVLISSDSGKTWKQATTKQGLPADRIRAVYANRKA